MGDLVAGQRGGVTLKRKGVRKLIYEVRHIAKWKGVMLQDQRVKEKRRG